MAPESPVELTIPADDKQVRAKAAPIEHPRLRGKFASVGKRRTAPKKHAAGPSPGALRECLGGRGSDHVYGWVFFFPEFP